MTGLEPLVVGYLSAWALRKARRVGDRVDGTVDHALDATLDRLDGLVRERLGTEPAIMQLEQAAIAGRPSEPITGAAEEVVGEAVTADPHFAAGLRSLVNEIRALDAGQQLIVNVTGSGQAKMPVLGSGIQNNTFN